MWKERNARRYVEAATLGCAIYVDLNQIRAGEALTPETSRHTSAYNRIQGLRQRLAQRRKVVPRSPLPDHWLCELTLEERGDRAAPGPQCSRSAWRASDKGLLGLSVEKYLELLDWSGRQVRSDKPGAIPNRLGPILDRLGINKTGWVETISSFNERFGLVVGSAKAVSEAAQRAGHRWFRGVRHCAEAFG